MHLRTALTAAAVALAFPLHAADSQGNYAIWGLGQASCNQFANAYERDAIEDFKAYLLGYLTAYNTLREDTYQGTGGHSAVNNLQWLYEHCDLHRLESFEGAIQQLLLATHEARFRTPPGHTGGWGRPVPQQGP